MHALGGEQLICQAKSGTGKTAVFVLAVLNTINTESENVECLVITNTRELAQQVRLSLKVQSRVRKIREILEKPENLLLLRWGWPNSYQYQRIGRQKALNCCWVNFCLKVLPVEWWIWLSSEKSWGLKKSNILFLMNAMLCLKRQEWGTFDLTRSDI